jgi:hypothetical protein
MGFDSDRMNRQRREGGEAGCEWGRDKVVSELRVIVPVFIALLWFKRLRRIRISLRGERGGGATGSGK